MSKKILSLVCVCALALCLAVPAFADDPPAPLSNGASVDFTGTPAEGEIAVVMQYGKTNLYVNPYGLPYNLGYGEVYATPGATTFNKDTDLAIKEPSTSLEGFFSDTAVIQNNGDVDLKVKVTMTTTAMGNALVMAEANVPTATNRVAQYMFGNLEITTANITTGNATVTTTAANDELGLAAAKTEVSGVKIVEPDWSTKKAVAIPASSNTAGTPGAPSAVTDTQVVLPAATTTGVGDAAVTTPGVVAYRLAGTTVAADKAVDPATSPALWTEADVADVAVAFTFEPDAGGGAGPAPTITATITEGAGNTSIASGETANLTVALSDVSKSIDSVAWTATNNDTPYVNLGGSTNATETATWAAAGGSVTITATVTYDTTETVTATFTLGTT